jgi:hypothetical protein
LDNAQKELLVARVLSGSTRFRRNGRVYWLRQPSRDERYVAQEVYVDAVHNAELEGLFTEQELVDYLIENNLWDAEKTSMMKQIEKDIEEFKVGLYNFAFQATEQRRTRAALEIAKKKHSELYNQLHAYDHQTTVGVASLKRLRYLIGCSLYRDDKRVWQDEGFWRHRSSLLDDAVAFYIQTRLTEVQYRELARSDTWRSYWSARKAGGSVFGTASVDMTEEQRQLSAYSTLYDSVYEHPEAPPELVIADDDMLDGWMILQRRQRMKQSDQNLAEQFIKNDKIKNAGEVFIMADSPEMAQKVESLNDPTAAATKRMRMRYLAQKGEVEEGEMPDSKREIQMQYNRLMSQAGKA